MTSSEGIQKIEKNVMIGHLKGTVIHKKPPEILLQVSGVGYEVTLPLICFSEIGEIHSSLEIYIHTLVREDSLQLYGFNSINQRTLFRELIKINGIGAKIGIAILSSMSVEELCHCVHTKDAMTLTKLPGIGKKTAERLLLDLTDRIENLNISHAMPTENNRRHHADSDNDTLKQVISALVSLGYKNTEAEKRLQALPNKNLPVAELIREALKTIC